MRKILMLLQALFFLLVTQLPALAENNTVCLTTGWPSERSDLKADPALFRGTLENGMRYVVVENHEPENRVAMHLNVQAGSLRETDEQSGVAHYLEHMLFNGTTNFPPGKLIEFFQSIGMSFGGDTNAHTSYDETVYTLTLPDGSTDNLQKGMLVLSDYVRGALLLESEVERERGVILAERRSRDSASYRSYVAGSRFKLRGTLLPERMAIGDEKVLKTADSALLKAYYDAWYRPENILLVIVGDIVPENIIPMISDYFSPLQGSKEPYVCPDFGALEHSGLEVLYHFEEEMGRSEVSIESLWDEQPQHDSLGLQRQELLKYTSILAMQNRLRKMEESQGDVISGSGYYSGDILQRVGYSTIMARTQPGKWLKTLQLLDEKLRQALQYGFFKEEIERVKRDLIADLESSVLTSESRDSSALAGLIIKHFNSDRVFQSPEQELELYSDMIRTMTVEDVNRSLRGSWQNTSRLISVKGATSFDKEGGTAQIRQAYLETSTRQIARYQLEDKETFPYLEIPQPPVNALSKRVYFPEIDAERIELSNNISVILKKTDYEPNTIHLSVDIGEGKLSEPERGLALLTERIINDSGTGRLTKSTLGEVLSGTTVQVGFHVGEESFKWSGMSVSDDIELLLQVIYTLIHDPGVREEAHLQAMNGLQQMYDSLDKNINGVVRSHVARFLADGDPRIGLPEWEQLSGIDNKRIHTWLRPQLDEGSMEVAIVGDFEPEKMRALALKYFGGWKARKSPQADLSELSFPSGRDLVTRVNSTVEKSIVIAAWPTADFWDIGRTRRLGALSMIFKERLREVVREKLGATYSPVVYSAPSRVYRDYGKFVVQVVVAPGKEQEILAEIVRIGGELQSGGVNQEELERVKGPLLTSLKDTVKSNGYWLNSVLANSFRHPQQLKWSTHLLDDFQEITTGDVEILAARYLLAENMATAIVSPANLKK